MAAARRLGSPFSLILFLATASLVAGNIGDFDEHWQMQKEEAEARARAAYHPDPHSVSSHLNKHVHKAVDELEGRANSTRRELRHYDGPCLATNPIDRCWRCDPDWAHHRKRITRCILGFGRKTIGGKRGKYYVVTDASDDDLVHPRPGTLRHAVTRKEPLWIVFERSMIIRLNEELIVASYKTIDARGAQVHIAYGAQITLQFVEHVIIHGLHVHDLSVGGGGMIRDSADHFGFRTQSDGDGVSIFGSSNIWIDHLSMSNCVDGLIDAIEGSTAITISNSHFTHHNEALLKGVLRVDHLIREVTCGDGDIWRVMLFGARDSHIQDKIMQVTLAFNHFGRGLMQRMPRGRYGFFHVVNNDYTHWEMYAVGGNMNPTIISQGNRYIAPPVTNVKHNATEVTKREYTPKEVWKNWIWTSEGDLLQNGAFFVQSGPEKIKMPYSSADVIKSRPGEYVTRLTRFSGSLNCKIGQPC